MVSAKMGELELTVNLVWHFGTVVLVFVSPVDWRKSGDLVKGLII